VLGCLGIVFVLVLLSLPSITQEQSNKNMMPYKNVGKEMMVVTWKGGFSSLVFI
jgi:hypothetical protein